MSKLKARAGRIDSQIFGNIVGVKLQKKRVFENTVTPKLPPKIWESIRPAPAFNLDIWLIRVVIVYILEAKVWINQILPLTPPLYYLVR